jgi:hypothetical protein
MRTSSGFSPARNRTFAALHFPVAQPPAGNHQRGDQQGDRGLAGAGRSGESVQVAALDQVGDQVVGRREVADELGVSLD